MTVSHEREYIIITKKFEKTFTKRMRTTFIVTIFTAFVAGAAYGQLFERADFNELTVTEPGTPYQWADFNSDGRMDILEIQGYSDVRLHTASGGSFTTNYLDLGNAYLEQGYYVFNDHNGDGDIDILTIKENAVIILDNDPGNGFTVLQTGVTFPSYYSGKLLWVDLNGDLMLDIVMGQKIYLKGNGSYKESTYILPDLLSNKMLDDMNGDGLIDIVAGGYESSGGTDVSILLNKGEGHFDVNNVILPTTNLRSSTITLLDVDRDADIDIFAVDQYDRSWIFKNGLAQTGNMVFTGAQIQSTSGTRALAGDINSDGLQDLIVAGGPSLTILKNTTTASGISFTSETYEQVTDAVLSLALVDIDLDNDLDIQLKTYSYYNGSANLLFKNKSASPGAIPTTPSNLASEVSTNVSLSWTNMPGMLYNLELKRNGLAYKPSYTSASGRLLLPAGNFLRKNGSLTVRELPAGTYQWRLQAISASGRSSAFTTVNSFTVGEGPSALTAQASALEKVRLCWSYNGPGNPSFAIFRKVSSGISAEIGRVAAGVLCFEDNNVPSNGRVEYYVTAVAGTAYTAPSNTIIHHSSMFVESSFGMTEPNIITARCLPADYDMDGDYDLEFIGRIGSFYNNIQLKNDGTGLFSPAGPMLTYDAFRRPYTEMPGPRDMDNDGDPDLVLVTGEEYSWQKITVFNNNNGSFTTGFETPQYLGISQLAVEDMNSDGRQDLLFSHTVGNSSGNPSRFQILYQKADGSFEDSHIQLVKEETAAVAFFKCVDLNGDGFLDILWTPSDKNVTEILVNEEGMGFTRKASILPATYYMGVEDYTGDGYIDVAILGNEGLNVYFGKADLTFNEPKVIPISSGSFGTTLINADLDLNGWPDLVLSGEYGSMVVLNNGNGSFKESDILIKQNWGTSIAITDFENDGDIDMVKLGNDSQHQGFNYLYKNQLADVNVINLPPAAPTNFLAAYDSGKVTLKWSASTDDRTPSPLLTYNLQIVDSNGKIWLNAETLPAGNFRRRFVPGNAGHSTSKTLNYLPPGTYTARVQAIDASFALSGWSTNVQVTIMTGPTALTVERILLNKVTLEWNGSPHAETGVVIEKKTVDSDWTTAAILPAGTTSYVDAALEYNTLYQYRVFESVGMSTTATSNIAEWNTNMWVMQATDIANIYGYIDVADFTGDGRMDMVLNGAMNYNGYAEDITRATFENTLNDGWVKRDITPSVLSPSAVISFADFNDDFKPDIYQNGWVWETGYHSEVYNNNGDKTFSPASNFFSGGSNAIESFFDFDMDNDLDIMTTQPTIYPTIREIYRNNGGGDYAQETMTACMACGQIVAVADFDRDGDEDAIRQFNYDYQLFLNTPQGLTSTDVVFSAYENGIAVTDYNDDGYPDIALLTSSHYHGGVILKNLGSQDGAVPQFVKLAVDLSSGDQKSVSADFDHDGHTDLAVLSPHITILRNKGSDTFESYSVPNIRVGLQAAKVIDFDNDGDLDIVFSGYLLRDYTDYLRKTQVLVNQTIASEKGITNEPPQSPVALSSTQDELGLHLLWSAPGDDHTSPEGLTYDVVLYRDGRIITKGNLNPITGQRLRMTPGKFTGTATFNNLEVGSYIWKVQAIDGSFAGSALSAEGTFLFLPPPPTIRDTTIYRCGRAVTVGAGGSDLKWYRDKDLTQLIASGEYHPEQTQTVFVTRTVNQVEGVPKEIHINISDKPAMPPAGAYPMIVCEGSSSQIISAIGLNITWYSDASLTHQLAKQQQLEIPAANATYYATQTIDECESNALAMQITVQTIDSEIYSDGVDIRTREEGANYYIWYRNGIFYASTQLPKIPFDGQVATYEVSVVKGNCIERSQPFVSSPDNVTSVEEAPESVLSIYPNPTTSIVMLKTQKTSAWITVLDAMGKRIYSTAQRSAVVETLDVRQWTKGVYTVVINDGKAVYTKRLIIL